MRYSRETMEGSRSRLHHVAQDNPMINAELDNANLFYNDVTFNLSLKNPTCFISFINVVSIFSRKWKPWSVRKSQYCNSLGPGSNSFVFQSYKTMIA